MPLYFNNPPSRITLMVSSSQFMFLANMNDSLEWLSGRIESLGQGNIKRSGDLARGLAGPNLAKMSPNLVTLGRKIRSLSELCLFLLKLELRLHCYHYLDAVKKTNYWLTDEPTEPDVYIDELNRDLAEAAEILQANLPKLKIR
jgi:exocyst complex component 4